MPILNFNLKITKVILPLDKSWASFGKHGFEPVIMVAIDKDYSALRFRRAEYIKTMNKNKDHAMSEIGKAKAGK